MQAAAWVLAKASPELLVALKSNAVAEGQRPRPTCVLWEYGYQHPVQAPQETGRPISQFETSTHINARVECMKADRADTRTHAARKTCFDSCHRIVSLAGAHQAKGCIARSVSLTLRPDSLQPCAGKASKHCAGSLRQSAWRG